jgi:hypothetical protein
MFVSLRISWRLRDRRGTDSHGFADETELLLYSLEGRNLAWCAICAEEIPGVESGEVLDGSEELIAAYCRCDEFEVVGYRGMIDERVGDHFVGSIVNFDGG